MSASIGEIDDVSYTRWECDQCGKRHVKHNPPCNRCGGMSFSQVESHIEEEYDETVEDIPSRVYPNSVASKLTLAGGGLTVLSPALPWLEYDSFLWAMTYQGTDGYLPFVVLFGLMTFGVYLSAWETRKHAAITGLGLVVLGVALYHIVDPTLWLESNREIASSEISYGNGLYLAIVGGVSTVFGGLLGFLR